MKHAISGGPHGGHGHHGGGGHGHHGGGHGRGRGWGGPWAVWPNDQGDVIQNTTVELNHDQRARDGVTRVVIRNINAPSAIGPNYRIFVSAHDVMALGHDHDQAALAVLKQSYPTALLANTAAHATFRFAAAEVH
jgi:hypothetical protein